MKRWAGFLLLTLSGCMGMEEFYLEPYSTPEPPGQAASCGCQSGPTVSQTGPPPLLQTAAPMAPTSPPPIVQTSGSLPIIRNTGEPASTAPSPIIFTSGWTPQ